MASDIDYRVLRFMEVYLTTTTGQCQEACVVYAGTSTAI